MVETNVFLPFVINIIYMKTGYFKECYLLYIMIQHLILKDIMAPSNIITGDCVLIRKEPYAGFYDVVLAPSYG